MSATQSVKRFTSGERGTAFGGSDGGYVLMLTALMILPLVAFTGLAVDLGAWLARAAAMQRAADAASLAGVAYLPDTFTAHNVALEVAKQNGFDDADPEITVVPSDAGPQKLRVTITDAKVEQFFTRLFTGGEDVSIERQAVAEYVLPVSMGSPRNFLGTGNDPANMLPGSNLDENYWLAASGPCASVENGDYLLPITDANYYWSGSGGTASNPGNPPSANPPINWNRCTGSDSEGTTVVSPSYDPDGYFYAVEVPEGGQHETVYVWGYDLSHCTGSLAGDSGGGGTAFQTRFRLRGPDSNPYIPTDNPPIGSVVTFTSGNSTQCSTTSSGWRNQWKVLFTITDADPGIYFVQVQTADGSDTSASRFHQSNSFGLRASYTNMWDPNNTPCSTDPSETALFEEDCLGVYAIEWMSILADIPGGNPSFFLADIGDEHSGKILKVRLWDPGEGALALELLDPLGRSVSFDWEVINTTGSDTAPTGGWSGTVTQSGGVCPTLPCNRLDVLGNDPAGTGRGWNPQPGPYRGSRSKYSDRLLELRVKLPNDIGTEYAGRTWWRVRYTVGAGTVNLTDRTSWSVTVTGDPVRLIE